MRQKKRPEIVPGDKELRWQVLLALGLYILWLLWLQPLIDWLLLQVVADPLNVTHLNQLKIRVAGLAFSMSRMLPTLLFLWIGYRVVTSASLPPAKMRFPFTVLRIKGRTAKMFGLLLITISLLVIANEAHTLTELFITK